MQSYPNHAKYARMMRNDIKQWWMIQNWTQNNDEWTLKTCKLDISSMTFMCSPARHYPTLAWWSDHPSAFPSFVLPYLVRRVSWALLRGSTFTLLISRLPWRGNVMARSRCGLSPWWLSFHWRGEE